MSRSWLVSSSLSPQDQFIIFGDPKLLSDLESFSNVTIVPLKTPIYSLAEQLINPFIFYSHHLDLLHVPHFNAPLLYFKKTIITVHDLIKHLSTGPDTTTLPSWQYHIKHLAYRFLINRNLKTSTAIITPSHYWKNYLITQLKVPSAKIFVTYEAVNAGLKPVDTPDKTYLKNTPSKSPTSSTPAISTRTKTSIFSLTPSILLTPITLLTLNSVSLPAVLLFTNGLPKVMPLSP